MQCCIFARHCPRLRPARAHGSNAIFPPISGQDDDAQAPVPGGGHRPGRRRRFDLTADRGGTHLAALTLHRRHRQGDLLQDAAGGATAVDADRWSALACSGRTVTDLALGGSMSRFGAGQARSLPLQPYAWPDPASSPSS